MSGLTDLLLVQEWCDAGRPTEYHSSGIVFVLCLVTLDFDYEMAYLLEVREGPGGEWSRFVYAYVKHAGSAEVVVKKGRDEMDLFSPYNNGDRHRQTTIDFVHWTYEQRKSRGKQ